MAHILMAAMATPGHVYPLLTIARYLVEQGNDVTLFSGALFREQAEAAGVGFIPFSDDIDFDYRHLEQHFPQRAMLPPGNAQMALALKDFFAAPIPLLDRQLRDALAKTDADLLMVENCFYGVLPLLLSGQRPPVIVIGVTPLSYSTRDSVFYGPRIPPKLLPPDLSHEQLVDEETRALMSEVQRAFDHAMVQSGGKPLEQPFMDALIGGCDRFLQLSTTELEYQRDDLPQSVRFIGPLSHHVAAACAPQWWASDDSRPLIIVSQGTLANVDLQQLIGPTLRALADLPIRVLATTGGRSVESLQASLPENARVVSFLAYDDWLPEASILITNGGYGSINAALKDGVPLIVAGVGEDKQEGAARVVFAKCGINLQTSTPSEQQIKQSVIEILEDPGYLQRARWIKADYASHDALALIQAEVHALSFSKEYLSKEDGIASARDASLLRV
ncbi:glycosyltransferase [Pectobacterium aroidearum]|uniref:Glycosyltransferase n=1 Tax=Pectobacterium aroidearum TaxID=1201031 RepID=A0ABR5ZIB3_9GAMM|nr:MULTISPECIES: nucleotide disphospho-sugar-binding domain-containing protein [Pectobacterium]MBA5201518.1 glycosyltransferase [Pectobacterium aroidearum]MBA5229740.1 glycosyltransferase [Pectobacterium aroidearum]MBA5234310.1 glycosyltransferase [Pectobacterium aroidearum]MBA5739428.1 glycosyltransferase [Pectobacterium aroidearum]UXJ99352.1 glycosyltransferase [Pectobacterium aroidearum]